MVVGALVTSYQETPNTAVLRFYCKFGRKIEIVRTIRIGENFALHKQVVLSQKATLFIYTDHTIFILMQVKFQNTL